MLFGFKVEDPGGAVKQEIMNRWMLSFIGVAMLGSEKLCGADDYVPKGGFVPDKETAIAIAVAIWKPIYGREILKEKPYTAELIEGVWRVSGTVRNLWGLMGVKRGAAEAEIDQKSGRILKVGHGK